LLLELLHLRLGLADLRLELLALRLIVDLLLVLLGFPLRLAVAGRRSAIVREDELLLLSAIEIGIAVVVLFLSGTC